MKVWRQLIASVVVLALVFFAWVKLDPNAATTLAKAGVPVPAALQPADRDAAQPGAERDSRRMGGRGGASVIVADVGSATVNDRFSAIGTGAPARTVSVQPQVSGIIEAIEVASGSMVQAGDVLVRLESTEQEIARDQARIALETARDKVERAENLLRQRTISSVEADAAKTERDTAELALRQAELELERRTIRAPIAGTIGILNVNRGDYVTNQTVISTIDDRQSILVEFYVPERLVGAIEIGAPVTAQSIARPGETFEGHVSALDNRLDEASRTLRVRAEIPNKDDRLRAGMSFQIRMRFPGETYPSVDPLAIQWDSDGSYVWRVTDGKAERVAVTIMQRNPENVLVESALEVGHTVVIEGVQNVRAGAAVDVVDREEPDAEEVPAGTTVKSDNLSTSDADNGRAS